ncbi:MAG: hypothetical protein QM781_11315 [Chitinophagaceae bacterium]
MRRYVPVLLLTAFVTWSCNQGDQKKTPETPGADTSNTIKPDSNGHTAADSIHLFELSEHILTLLKSRQYDSLSSFIHPQMGIRFSPTAYVDTVDQPLLSVTAFRQAIREPRAGTWGVYNAETDEPRQLTLPEYLGRYAYDKDYLQAPQKACNRFLGGGNSLNNLKTIYPQADFTEYYFPGFEPKYEGLDWKTLRLVFRMRDGKTWLIAVIRDEWTI